MKQILIALILILSLVGCNTNKLEENTVEIYAKVKNENFYRGEIEKEKTLLYNTDMKMIKEIKMEKKILIDILYFEKNGDNIFFITGGSLDDLYGIVYAEKSNVNMNGINKIERIGGNSFYFE